MLYINFIIIPLFIWRVIIEIILLPLEILVYIIKNPIGWVHVLISYITYPVLYIIQFFIADTTWYIFKRLLNWEDKVLVLDYRIRQITQKIKKLILNIKKGLIYIFKTLPYKVGKLILKLILYPLNLIRKVIRILLNPLVRVGARLLLWQLPLIRKCFILFYRLAIGYPVLSIYKSKKLWYKLLLNIDRLLIFLLTPVVRKFEKYLEHENRYNFLFYRKMLWKIAAIVEFFMIKKPKKPLVYEEFYWEENINEKNYYNKKKLIIKNKVSNEEMSKLLLKYKLKANWLIKLVLLLNNLNLRAGKWDTLTANLLIYMSKDLNKVKSVKDKRWSLDRLSLILGFKEIEKKSKNPVTIQYRQPDFQTDKENRLITNKWSKKKIYNIFIKPEYTFIFKKHKNEKWIVTVREILLLMKKELEDWWYGNKRGDDEYEDIVKPMPDGTFAYVKATEEEIASTQEKAWKNQNNFMWKEFWEPVKEEVETQQQTTEKIINLFYLSCLEYWLKDDVFDELPVKKKWGYRLRTCGFL